MKHRFKTPSRLLAAAVFAGLLAGCAHVGQDEFQSEMDQIREEMQSGDQQLANRIDDVEASVAALEERMDALETDLQDLAAEYDATVSRLEASLRFAAPVHFNFDESEVRPQDRELLMRFANVIREHYPGALVTVEGFTDPAGPAEYNLYLGQQRADAVKTTLVNQGRLSSDRVRAVSYGENTERLVAPGAAGRDNPAAVANRRVVLVVEHATQGRSSMTTTES